MVDRKAVIRQVSWVISVFLQGDDDPMIPKVNARVMARLIPNSRIEFIDCGHLFILTRLGRISPLIQNFVHSGA